MGITLWIVPPTFLMRWSRDTSRKMKLKKELEEKMKNEVAPAWVKNMTTILTSNGGQWLVGKGLTWADIAVSMIVEMMAAKDEAILTKCPPLGDHMKRIHSQ